MKSLIQRSIFAGTLFLFFSIANAQQDNSLFKDSGWSIHFQFTGIIQSHPEFNAPYAGQNSLDSNAEKAYSTTATIFLGRKLWKGASIFFNPEMVGGKGIGSTLGIAGFPNGETFRIGSPVTTVYIGRLFLRQHIALGNSEEVEAFDDVNQVREKMPSSRITLNLGKFSLSDFFDNNDVSHDPRNDFLNWALMSNGAYDYAANTRGYTVGLVAEFVKPAWALRFGTALMPTYANGPDLDFHYFKTNSETIEFEKKYSIKERKGVFRVLGYFNTSKAPNYDTLVQGYLNGSTNNLDVIYGTNYGGKKYGFGINIQQEISDVTQMFMRLGWNDGHTATWAFAEIDNSISAGIRIFGKGWKRNEDNIGIALLTNGISSGHRNLLNAGGYGFMIGDGKLPNYARENILEVFYQMKLYSFLWGSLDYQFVSHPAYNADRGPVHVFAARVHVEL
ncbi:MAG: carbohydrate porin [Chitinophagales bacterium]